MTRILGIDFFQGSPEEAARQALAGGLTVAPAAPTLADLDRYPAYQNALESADLAVVDSGFLVLCWKRLTGQSMSRLSGLLLLQNILEQPAFRESSKQLWAMPTPASIEAAKAYLASIGVELDDDCFYAAPMYPVGEIEDPALLEIIHQRRPELIMLNVAGGKQEVLGAWLKAQLDYRPGIVCTGAAIAFLTGEQANIPSWGDRFFMGWLLRIFSDPRRYFPRYWQARRLWRLLKTYREASPPQRNAAS